MKMSMAFRMFVRMGSLPYSLTICNKGQRGFRVKDGGPAGLSSEVEQSRTFAQPVAAGRGGIRPSGTSCTHNQRLGF